MLDDHRISRLDTSAITTTYPRTVGRNARLGSHGAGFDSTVVTITTDHGATGWGLLADSTAGIEAAVGRRVGDVFDPDRGVIDEGLFALDFALHDLAATILDQPLHVMLGSRGSTSTPCYSGAIYFDDLDPDDAPRGVEAVLANCAADWAAGFRAFKLKIGRGHRWLPPETGFARDVEVTRAVRQAHPNAELLVDANNGYTPQETIAFLQAVEDCGIFWMEEPFHEHEAGLRLLRDHLSSVGSRVLVADGEHEPDEQHVLDLAAKGLIDVVLMDVVSFGLTAWRRIMPRLRELGVAASPHAWGMPLKTVYAAHLAAGLGNVVTVEGVPGITVGVELGENALVNGEFQVSSAPGFGLSLLPRSDR